jgi:rare lipoprotein A
MNPNAMTAAHKTLPFGTQVKVTDQRTGNAILVTINDRGPFIRGRIIDLSKAAAGELGFRRRGHTEVCIVQV